MLMVRLRPLLRQKPLKGKSIGLLLDTQSHKQSQKKINTLQESEQGSTEESGAWAPRIADIIVFFKEYQMHCLVSLDSEGSAA